MTTTMTRLAALAAASAFGLGAANAATVTTAAAGDGSAASATVAATLSDALLQGGTSGSSGITIVAGSQRYIGADGQGGTYAGAQFGPISIADGVILTTGDAVVLTGAENTANETSVDTLTGGNAAIDDLRGVAGDTFNQTVLSFDFVLNDPSNNAVALDFLFGSEEFPDNGEPDTFAVFLTDANGDLVNFAQFADGELIGVSDQTNFNDNTDGNPFGVELNGLTDVLTLTALLDPDVIGAYTLTIALADTGDELFDSAVFLTGLRATTAMVGGIDPVPLPGAALLFPLGIAGLAAARRAKR